MLIHYETNEKKRKKIIVAKGIFGDFEYQKIVLVGLL